MVCMDIPFAAGGDPPKQTCAISGMDSSFCNSTVRFPSAFLSLKFQGVFTTMIPSFLKPRSLFNVYCICLPTINAPMMKACATMNCVTVRDFLNHALLVFDELLKA